MKIFGMTALVLALVMGSCAYEKAWVKDTPVQQRASIYLMGKDTQIEKVNGNWLGFAARNYKYGTVIHGTDTQKTRGNVINRSMELTPGEHKLTISDALIVGRKSYEGTFDFEPGKRYIVQLVPPSLYETMISPTYDGNLLGNLANNMKEALAGNQIIIIAESKTDPPSYGFGGPRLDWKKSK